MEKADGPNVDLWCGILQLAFTMLLATVTVLSLDISRKRLSDIWFSAQGRSQGLQISQVYFFLLGRPGGDSPLEDYLVHIVLDGGVPFQIMFSTWNVLLIIFSIL